MLGASLVYLFFGTLALLLPESLGHLLGYGSRELPMRLLIVGTLTLWSLSMIPWIRLALGGKRIESRLVLVVPIALMALLSIWVAPLLSLDLYHYVAFGRQVAMYGASPYTQILNDFLRDPVIAAGNPLWYGLPAPYGCLAIACFALANLVGPNSGLSPLAHTTKAFWIFPYAWLGQILWTRWQASRDRTALVFACLANPVMLYLALVEGHVDICVLPFLLYTIIAVEKEEPVKAALALTAAVCFKAHVFILTPICACWLWRRHPRKAIVFFLLFLAIYGAILGLLGGAEWPGLLLQSKTSYAGQTFAAVVPKGAYLLGMREITSIIKVSNGLFYLSVAGICLAVLTGRARSNPFFTAGLAMAALYFTRTYVQPWYTLWFWPLLWLSTNSTRTILTSMALWSAATLFANLYFQEISPWVIALAFVADVVWNHRRSQSE